MSTYFPTLKILALGCRSVGECLTNMNVLVFSAQLGISNYSPGEVEAGGSETQGCPWLYCKSDASLRSYLGSVKQITKTDSNPSVF